MNTAAKLNIQAEFKRQLDFLKSPYDTFHNGRLTHQTLLSTKGFSSENRKAGQLLEVWGGQTREKEEIRDGQRGGLKHTISQQNLHEQTLGFRPQDREIDPFEERLKRYSSLSKFDPGARKQETIEMYRKKYSGQSEAELHRLPPLKKAPVVSGEKNLEVEQS